MLGLIVGVIAGVVMATVVLASSRCAAAVLAIALVINSAPIIAMAPIANNLFGVTSILSKVAVCAVMAFFPIFVNTTAWAAVDPGDPARCDALLGGPPGEITGSVRWPNACPTSSRPCASPPRLAVIGAIVTEYFGGPTDALGVYIAHAAALSRMAPAWAGMIVASVMGVALYGTFVTLIERFVIPWHASLREA